MRTGDIIRLYNSGFLPACLIFVVCAWSTVTALVTGKIRLLSYGQLGFYVTRREEANRYWFALSVNIVFLVASLIAAVFTWPGEPDYPPQLVYQVAPHLPPELTTSGPSGDVEVEYSISKSGDVVEAHVVSAANPVLGQAAIKAILHWKFLPGVKAGKPVNTHVRQTIRFGVSKEGKQMQSSQPVRASGPGG